MKTLFQLTIVPVSVTLSWMLMGINACQPLETDICDGLDNDGDGFIDEDFDSDLDGYFSVECGGGDCDDQAITTHPGAHEAIDALDNDCDGRVDEVQQPYTLNFVNNYTGGPQSGVLVWLGDDGRQAYSYSDASGKVTFELEGPVQTISYAYTYLRTSSTSSLVRDYRRVVTLRNEPLSDGQEFTLWDVSAVGRETVEGIAYNIDLSIPQSNLLIQDDGLGTYYDVTRSSIPYSLSAYDKDHQLLVASQTEYVIDENGFEVEVGLPVRFGIVEEPTYPQDIALEHSFSQPMTYRATNLDPSMTHATPDLSLYFLNGASVYFGDETRALSGVSSVETRLPPLVGSLAQARVEVDFAAWNADGFGQGGEMIWDGQTSALNFELKPLHSVTQTASLTIDTLPGTVVELQSASDSDRESVIFYQLHQDVNKSTYTYMHIWTVNQKNTGESLTFPTFPKLTSNWQVDPSIQLALKLDASTSFAYYSLLDGAPYAYTAAPVDTTVTPAIAAKNPFINGGAPQWGHSKRMVMLEGVQ